MHIVEFYYKNATLLYHDNRLNKRKYYLDKKNISTNAFSPLVALCQGHAVLPSGWVGWIYGN
jgi:hypothetical protein